LGPAEALAIFAAGVGAGAINSVVGSGSLVTFPVLLAFGYPPVLANVSNNIGVIPGNMSGVWGYRAELAGQRQRLLRLGVASVAGALAGALMLLELPPHAFQVIVPVLILIACGLVIVQPWLSRRLAERRRRLAERRGQEDNQCPHGSVGLVAGVLGIGIYGGYFGGAQGVLLIGLLGTFLDDDLQRINAAKNVLAAVANTTAAVIFILLTQVNWMLAVLIAAGSVIGGLAGARLGRRLPPLALRCIVVLVGVVAAVRLLA
jgi:uncharacterized protein